MVSGAPFHAAVQGPAQGLQLQSWVTLWRQHARPQTTTLANSGRKHLMSAQTASAVVPEVAAAQLHPL